MIELAPDVSRQVGTAVGQRLGHWPGGNDWDVVGCVTCGFAQVRFHSGIKLASVVRVRGWNLPAELPSVPRVLNGEAATSEAQG
jgi:hypothetical protein